MQNLQYPLISAPRVDTKHLRLQHSHHSNMRASSARRLLWVQKQLISSPRLRCFASLPIESTSVDLTRYAPRPSDAWDQPKRWVVFSDLHVSPRTLPICLSVLDTVHKAAVERDAGIIFLGDFWHMRGSLPVEPLNQVINAIKQWQDTPALFLVGNHDQVTLGGMVHSLTPLAAASPNIHVFDGPAIFRNALWLPYRRYHAELQHAIAAADTTTIKAVFAHADVVGASMNDAIQAKEGVLPDIFPPGIPSYTGHYHKPHTVPGTSIRYVGSPFQVSRSEAGQEKHLLVLDASNWQTIEEIPLSLGPKHYSVVQQQVSDTELVEDMLPIGLQSGDRLRLSLPEESIKKSKKLITKLQKSGIELELLTVTPPSAPRIAASEDLGPVELFKHFATMRNLSPEVVGHGAALLQELADDGATATNTSEMMTRLSFHSVEIEGYFSFKAPVKYDLANRGLIVITGSVVVQDQQGSVDSNGAGKTALVMAPYWAVTGDVDARSELGTGKGLTNSDIVNEDSKLARVRLEGSVNGVPFVVERTAVRRGKGSGLTFTLDGEDLTKQEMRLTQAEIDRHLGTSLLGRTVFYGQSEITALLEANDRAFKDELGKLVDLGIWEAAKDATRNKLALQRGELNTLENESVLRRSYRDQFEMQLQQSKAAAALWEEERIQRESVLKEQVDLVVADLDRDIKELKAAMRPLQQWRDSDVFTKEEEDGSSTDDHHILSQLQSLETEQQQMIKELQKQLQDAQVQYGASKADYTIKLRALDEYTSLHEHQHGELVCDRCLQPVDPTTHSQNCDRLQEELDVAQYEVQEAESVLAAVQSKVAEAQSAHMETVQTINTRRQELDAFRREQQILRDTVDMYLTNGSRCLTDLQASYQRIHTTDSQTHNDDDDEASITVLTSDGDVTGACQVLCDMTNAAQNTTLQEARRVSALLSSAVNSSTNPHDAEIQRVEQMLEKEQQAQLESEKRTVELEKDINCWKKLDEAFRPSGIVSFALEGVLGALQEATAQHLATLAPEFTLELAPYRPSKSDPDSVIERVERIVKYRPPGGGIEARPRSIRQLSGGERRRVALALALGFSQLAARKGRLHSDMLVLDEVMQHLDGQGCMRLAGLLRQLPYESVFVVAQAHSFETQAFDAIDLVQRTLDGSTVVVGGGGA